MPPAHIAPRRRRLVAMRVPGGRHTPNDSHYVTVSKLQNLTHTTDYFIKTGTYSSKFDFRNAHVTTAKEVDEVGQYLLYIQNQAVMMAGPLYQPCYYGVSTTNEWVVREFVRDCENNPAIYQGLPLHTEYRFFVDFDADEILGVSPYWEPKVMKRRFGHENDADSPHMKHDYVIYKMHEKQLMKRYNERLPLLRQKVAELVPLSGQWSLDIMQNGDDFFIIDMAEAANSALRECIPAGKLRLIEEKWLPQIGDNFGKSI